MIAHAPSCVFYTCQKRLQRLKLWMFSNTADICETGIPLPGRSDVGLAATMPRRLQLASNLVTKIHNSSHSICFHTEIIRCRYCQNHSLQILPKFHMQSLQFTTLNSSFQKSQWQRIPVIKIITIIISQCLTIGLQPVPKLVTHTVRSSASDLNLQYLLVSLRETTSCLRLHRRLFVPSNFPAITCFKGQFLGKMCPIRWDCHTCIACRKFFNQAKWYKLGNVRYATLRRDSSNSIVHANI
jgi:hypothetical protein